MAEIKIEDLSIGDWVRYRDADANVRVNAIYSDGYVFIVGEEDSGISENLNAHHYLEPIPLTPEILEKNGFEELKDKSWVGHNHHCHIQQHGSSWTLLANKRGFYRTIRFESLAFVHELQNALRLAGVEKEIEV